VSEHAGALHLANEIVARNPVAKRHDRANPSHPAILPPAAAVSFRRAGGPVHWADLLLIAGAIA
jgi:hypothetical protein